MNMAVPVQPLVDGKQSTAGLIRVAAFDPAMRNWGMARLLVDPDTLSIAQVVELKLTTTESQAGKTVRKSSDDFRRASEAYVAAMQFACWANLLVAEVPSGSQSSRASLGAGMSIGLLAALDQINPLFQVDPISVKKQVTGRRTASKDEMIAWAVSTFPNAKWLTRKVKGEVKLLDANEHLADALAIAVTALRTSEFKASVRMLKGMRVA